MNQSDYKTTQYCVRMMLELEHALLTPRYYLSTIWQCCQQSGLYNTDYESA